MESTFHTLIAYSYMCTLAYTYVYIFLFTFKMFSTFQHLWSRCNSTFHYFLCFPMSLIRPDVLFNWKFIPLTAFGLWKMHKSLDDEIFICVYRHTYVCTHVHKGKASVSWMLNDFIVAFTIQMWKNTYIQINAYIRCIICWDRCTYVYKSAKILWHVWMFLIRTHIALRCICNTIL